MILAVGAVVVDRDGRVLLIRRAHEPAAGTWSIPGGRVEPGESSDTAAVRELREETAVGGRVIGSLGRETVAAGGIVYSIDEQLLVPVGDPNPRAGDDAAEVRWASESELAELEVGRDIVAVIEKGIARARALGHVA
jgi:ADP-ribose pyrophosphatase YjhB (NUDIX family)